MIRSSFFLFPADNLHTGPAISAPPRIGGATGYPTPKPTLHARIPAHPLSHTRANIRETPS